LRTGGRQLYILSAAMKRAAQYNAYVYLKKAYEHLMQYGVVTNPSPTVAQVLPYTNRFSIQGTNYDCVLGLKWKPLSRTDIVMVVTRNGSVIYLDGQEAPRFIDFGLAPPAAQAPPSRRNIPQPHPEI